MGNQRLGTMWTAHWRTLATMIDCKHPETRVREVETLLLRDQQPALGCAVWFNAVLAAISGGCTHGRRRTAHKWVNLLIG